MGGAPVCDVHGQSSNAYLKEKGPHKAGHFPSYSSLQPTISRLIKQHRLSADQGLTADWLTQTLLTKTSMKPEARGPVSQFSI